MPFAHGPNSNAVGIKNSVALQTVKINFRKIQTCSVLYSSFYFSVKEASESEDRYFCAKSFAVNLQGINQRLIYGLSVPC